MILRALVVFLYLTIVASPFARAERFIRGEIVIAYTRCEIEKGIMAEVHKAMRTCLDQMMMDDEKHVAVHGIVTAEGAFTEAATEGTDALSVCVKQELGKVHGAAEPEAIRIDMQFNFDAHKRDAMSAECGHLYAKWPDPAADVPVATKRAHKKRPVGKSSTHKKTGAKTPPAMKKKIPPTAD